MNKPLSEEEILDVLEHANRKGSHWYQHVFGKWQKHAKYAGGQDDPNAKPKDPLSAKDIHAPRTAGSKSEASDQNARIREASENLSTEELKQVTERIKAEKEFLEQALVKDYVPSKMDVIMSKIPGLLKKAEVIAVANKQWLADSLSDKLVLKFSNAKDVLSQPNPRPEDIAAIKQLKGQFESKIMAVLLTMEALNKASSQGGKKK